MVQSIIPAGPPGLDPQIIASGRTAEYAAADQAALAALGALLLLAALPSLFRLAGGRRGRKQSLSLFIGWGRLLHVILVGGVLPVAAYGVYAYATRMSGRQYGLLQTAGRLMVEYSALTVVLCFSIRTLADRAIRHRGRDIGILIPPRSPRRKWVDYAIGTLLSWGVIAYLAAWRPHAVGGGQEPWTALFTWSIVLSAALGLFTLRWLLPAIPRSFDRLFGLPTSGWLLYSGFAVTSALSLSLVLIEPLREWGQVQTIVLSVALSCAIVLLAASVMRLVKKRAKVNSPAPQPEDARLSARSPLVFAVASVAVLATGAPFLHHMERQSVVRADTGWSLLDEVDNSLWAQLKVRMLGDPVPTKPSAED